MSDAEKQIDAGPDEAVLVVEDLKKTYETGDQALKGVSFDVGSGEFVSIVGPSGAGKSTLIRCINRLVEPDSGKVSLEGIDVMGLSKGELTKARRDIGMIFQEFNLVERLSVMENVLSGRLGYTSTLNSFLRRFSDEDVSFALDTLERVGLREFADNRADELSGGQRQRVGIARAVVQRPRIILVDEPTSSLDPEISRNVMDLIEEVSREDNMPVLINLHDVDLAKDYGERILGLRDGEKIFDDLPEKFDEGAMDRIYRGVGDDE
ncbi:phosphonate ABC transporter ATP-binding protein [Candidatus Bipolaricaulota bacterium]|nr:phosphonate ABC transporter ATP-binding protein [Candidatus Bipolaricaulota bacterium]